MASGAGAPGGAGALAYVTAGLHAAAFLGFLALVPAIAGGERLVVGVDWIPALGIRLNALIDGLSLTFALLISGIGALIALYAGNYLAGHRHLGRFFLYLGLFSVAMLGLVLAANLITLFVFWELTTLTSYLLVGFTHGESEARRAARQALLVTGAGGLALLAGFILIGRAGGSLDMAELLAGDDLTGHALYPGILVLVLAGAFTKSAQMPFHFWLPNAMAAPTPVSAFLHSATMVKGGIYLLARLHPLLAGTPAWTWTLTVVGAATAVFASVQALRQTDLKSALAYTTLMALGTLTMFLGAEASVAIAAALTFLVVHALYKAGLFLMVGALDHATGTRDITQLGGLGRSLPVLALPAFALALAMSGFPPFLGFIGKELKYEGALAIASEPVLVAGAAVLSNALMVAVAGMVALRPFLGAPGPAAVAHRPTWPLWLPSLVLAVLSLALGLAPALVGHGLIQPAVTAVLGRPETVTLKLWHGINVPLVMSVATVALGLALYAGRAPLCRGLAVLAGWLPLSADRAWDHLLDGLSALARFQTRLIQGERPRHDLLAVFAVLVAALGGTWLVVDPAPPAWTGPAVTVTDLALVALITGGAIVATLARSRLTAIGGLGAVGTGAALVYLAFGAPDVALTQLLVETLTVVLLAAALYRLPALADGPRTRRIWRLARAGVAVLTGLITTALLLAVTATPPDRRITDFFEAASMPEAFGRNIVNVILVDFRAIDTFGEIVVVAVAALAAWALIRRGTTKREDS